MVKDINLDKIKSNLYDIMEACQEVTWFFDGDDDSLINNLIGDEDESYEFKMMFADLEAECEQMQDDFQDTWYGTSYTEYFNDLFVAAGGSSMGGGLLGYDAYEGDYFGLDTLDVFAEDESRKRLMRLTKEQLIDTIRVNLKILYAYLGLQNRYDNLKAAIDIIRDENTGYLQVAKKINETYERIYECTDYKAESEAKKGFTELINKMPQEAWLQ